MLTPTDWTHMLIQWGESRGWRSPSRRLLRKFREFAATRDYAVAVAATAGEGMAAEAALARDFATLAAATPAQRAMCACRADVRAVEVAQESARLAATAAAERLRMERVADALRRGGAAWVYLDTGYVEDFIAHRLSLPDAESGSVIPLARLAATCDWHRFRETGRDCEAVGRISIMPLVGGEPVPDGEGGLLSAAWHDLAYLFRP